MPRKIESMEFIHDQEDKADYSSFGPSADEDDDTPYDAFTKATAEDDEDGGVEVDLTPKKKPKAAAAEEEDDGFEIVADDEPAPKTKKVAAEEDEEDDGEISAEEMESYSDKVRNRIRKQTRMQRTAERRADRSAKEADQAVAIIQAQQEQINRMRQLIANGETQYVNAATVASKSALDSAKAKLKQALTDGDADGIVNAQADLAAAANNMSQTGQYRAVAPEIERDAGVIDARVKDFAKNRQAKEFEPDPAAKRWIAKNEWFEKDSRMRSYAIEFAKELEADGFDPIADAPEYYKEINKEMRTRFPEKFNDDERQARRAAPPAQRRPVAGGKSAGGGGGQNRVRLTESAVRTAQVLGIPLAEYAKEFQKMYGKKS